MEDTIPEELKKKNIDIWYILDLISVSFDIIYKLFYIDFNIDKNNLPIEESKHRSYISNN